VAERFPPQLSGMLLDDPDDAAELATKLRLWRPHAHAWRESIAPLGDQLRSYSWSDMAADFAATVQQFPSNASSAMVGGRAR